MIKIGVLCYVLKYQPVSDDFPIGAIACQDLDPTNGDFHPETGITTYTLWGKIDYCIGGIQGYIQRFLLE
jgi:hypothetical protein